MGVQGSHNQEASTTLRILPSTVPYIAEVNRRLWANQAIYGQKRVYGQGRPEVQFDPPTGQLYPFQAQALDDLLRHTSGVLEAPTGSDNAIDRASHRQAPSLMIESRPFWRLQ